MNNTHVLRKATALCRFLSLLVAVPLYTATTATATPRLNTAAPRTATTAAASAHTPRLAAVTSRLSALPAAATPRTPEAAGESLWRKGKKKKAKEAAAAGKAPSRYHTLTGRDSVRAVGSVDVVQRGDTFFLELPLARMGREWLVSNKLQRVPKELNEAGANRGVNYESQSVTFSLSADRRAVVMRQQRLTPEVPASAAMAASVADNYIDPILASLKVEAWPADSAAVLVKVNDLFNGKKNCLNDVFNQLNIGTSPVTDLSRIIAVKAQESGFVATSELTTVVHEGNSKVNVTVEVSSAVTLLPEHPMRRRRENWRVGYFTTPRLQFDDRQQSVRHTNYVTRWRLEPSDTAAYMRGELVEPVRPITFYIDRAVPAHLKPYIKKGITDWNRAFECAGFRNAVRVEDFTDSMAREGNDMKYSVLTYDASEKANAMGPSTIDPRTGEILEADIIWWHNVQSLIREWIMVQTGPSDPRARSLTLPDELIGDAVRFVACHEVGHSLGLRHNMIASTAYPTDSLRSAAFMSRMGGTSPSIMDYARFNYIAQPSDHVTVMSPHIGVYDLMAIEWGYRWWPEGTDERKELETFLARHRGREYRYSETQSMRSAADPRALSEDLGDDPVKSAKYGIANLRRIMPNLLAWTRTDDPSQGIDEASALYTAVVSQWSLYLYHVMANVGGIELERPARDEATAAYTFTGRSRQREAVQFLIDEVLTYPRWLFDAELSDRILLHRTTPTGVSEQTPNLVLRNQINYILWDLMDNERLMRMAENEMQNGAKAFTAAEMMDMLHRAIFAKTLGGGTPDAMERSLQKSFVDALITAANEAEGVKINKKLHTGGLLLPCFLDCEAEENARSLSSAARTVEFTNTQVTRNSDALSVKRGELLRIYRLVRQRRAAAPAAAQMHYDDLALRIQTALGKNAF